MWDEPVEPPPSIVCPLRSIVMSFAPMTRPLPVQFARSLSTVMLVVMT
jgi:hypothetical protein